MKSRVTSREQFLDALRMRDGDRALGLSQGWHAELYQGSTWLGTYRACLTLPSGIVYIDPKSNERTVSWSFFDNGGYIDIDTAPDVPDRVIRL